MKKSVSKPSSRDNGQKTARMDTLNNQKKIWLRGMHEENSSRPSSTIQERPQNEIQTTQVALENWYGISHNETNPSSSNNSSMCRLCLQQMKKPMMVIPCGHSFCETVFWVSL